MQKVYIKGKRHPTGRGKMQVENIGEWACHQMPMQVLVYLLVSVPSARTSEKEKRRNDDHRRKENQTIKSNSSPSTTYLARKMHSHLNTT